MEKHTVNMNKEHFLANELIAHLKAISPDTKPIFGKMNLHQMIEHLSFSFQQAIGMHPQPAANNEEITAKMYLFLSSDKPFRDNTPNQYMSDTPSPALTASVEIAIENLKKDIENFFTYYQKNESQMVANPFFGNLFFQDWVQLLHKHTKHHLRQFGIQLPIA